MSAVARLITLRVDISAPSPKQELLRPIQALAIAVLRKRRRLARPAISKRVEKSAVHKSRSVTEFVPLKLVAEATWLPTDS